MPAIVSWDVLREILDRIATKPPGDINDGLIGNGAALILICNKDDIFYVRYMLSAMDNGVNVFYILARGDAWSDKGDRVAAEVIAQRPDMQQYSRDEGTDEWKGHTVKSVLLTLVHSSLIAGEEDSIQNVLDSTPA